MSTLIFHLLHLSRYNRIKALDPSKPTGLDGLRPKIFKLAKNSLSVIIAILTNKSIHIGQLPNEMKCAKVFPIFMGGNTSNSSNYRPISVLSTISKIFERHVNKHLMYYLTCTKYKHIHKHQPGFRKKNIAARLHWSNLLINGYLVLIRETL